jgi:integrase
MDVRIYQRFPGGPWYVAFTNSLGKYVRRSLQTKDHSQAKRMAFSMALGVVDGKALAGEEATIAVLIEKFLSQPHTLRPKSRTRQEGLLKSIKANLGHFEITHPRFRAKVRSYRAERINHGRAVRTVNSEVSALHQVILWALDIYPGLTDPLAGLKRLKVPRLESKALEPDEVRKLLSALRTPDDCLRIGLYLYTGMRKAEGTNLWWCHVDLENDVITIEPHEGFSPKNGEPRIVPICPELKRILEEAPRRSTYVLTTRDGKPFLADDGKPLTRWVKAAYKRAGIKVTKGMGLHTLRHTYCSHLARQNIRAELRAKLVGHRTLSMQSIYSHSFQEDALEAGKGLEYA